MSARVEALILRKLRGATAHTRVDLDPSRRMAVVFGENGTGKSTLVDALDMVANGRCGTLDQRGSATVRQHLPSIGCPGGAVHAEVVVGGRSWTAKLSGSRIVVDGPPTPPAIAVLRRQRLAQLVEARPADRYEAMKALIDLPGIERSEVALGSAATAAQHGQDTELTRYTEADQALAALWDGAGRPSQAHRAWAESLATVSTGAVEGHVALLERLLRAIQRADGESQALRAAEERLEDAQAAQAAAMQAAAGAAELDGARAVALVDLLQRALHYMAEPGPDQACPVCDRAIDPSALRADIGERLRRLSDWVRLAERIKTAVQGLARAEEARQSAALALEAGLRHVCEAWVAAGDGVPGLPVPAAVRSFSSEHGADDSRCAARLSETALAGRADIERRLDAARKTVALRDGARRLLERLEESERNLAHQAALADRLGAMHSVAIDARKRFVQEMLSRVALDTSVLYERVHPGENVSLRSLELDPKYRASILQTANFHGTEGVAPQGYLSDAHMDTLGLCLWLAVVKQMGAADTVVVLDDVLTSLDDAHLGRLVDMIAEESRHFAQVIITTHYVPWRDHLARQAASGASVQVVELQPWSPQRGVQARPTVA